MRFHFLNKHRGKSIGAVENVFNRGTAINSGIVFCKVLIDMNGDNCDSWATANSVCFIRNDDQIHCIADNCPDSSILRYQSTIQFYNPTQSCIIILIFLQKNISKKSMKYVYISGADL